MKISVIIPAYNATSTIVKCLVALNKQTLQPSEIIVVDDGSCDGTISNIKYHMSKMNIKNLKILKQNHQGPGQARNKGARYAKGKILIFVDSDCIPPRDWIRKITQPFSDSNVGAVGGGYCSGVGSSFWQVFSNEELSFRRRGRGDFVTTLLGNNMACLASVFSEVGGFSKEYPVCEDMLFAYKISCNYKIRWLKNNGVKHHFKNSFLGYIKHQYFFGKESTRFFLDNPKVLLDNHQGKRLHIAIAASLLCMLSIFVSLILLLSSRFGFAKITLMVAGVMILAHFLLYIRFIYYLKQRKMSKMNLARSYLIVFCRNFAAAISFFEGLMLYLRKQKF